MLNRSASLAMSTSDLKALPGKLDIKRHSPTSSILYIPLSVHLVCLTNLLDAKLLDVRYIHLSYDVASRSEITPCNKICKPLVVYRFTGNVMTSITTLRK